MQPREPYCNDNNSCNGAYTLQHSADEEEIAFFLKGGTVMPSSAQSGQLCR